MALSAKQKAALNALLDAEDEEETESKGEAETEDDDDDHIIYRGRTYRPEKGEEKSEEKKAAPKKRRFVT